MNGIIPSDIKCATMYHLIDEFCQVTALNSLCIFQMNDWWKAVLYYLKQDLC